ncbi:MAG: ABC transporter ATP-binding protein/permease [Firmicutes bacterium]|nr:ABC transporter ATP-binding protein/permease [Bacillota bacterium]MCL5040038.1 ABC transporter ATP-binding protein/permease [Bacillota bacterium]
MASAKPEVKREVERSLWSAITPVLRHYWYLLAAAFTLVIGTSYTELLPPLILKNLVDNYLSKGIATGILHVALLYLGAMVATRAIQFTLSYIVALLGQNILFNIRMLLARRLEILPLTYFDKTSVGEVMSRITNDVDAVNTLFSAGMMNVITDLFRILGVLGAMYIVDHRLTVVVILSAPLVMVVNEYFRRNVREYQRKLRLLTASIYSFLQEAWSGMRVVRTHGAQPVILRRLDGLQDKYIRAADGASVYNAFFPGVLKSIEAATTAVVIWYGARPAVLDAGLTLGGLVAFAQLISRLHSPLQNLSEEWQTIQEALSGVERITEFLREPIDEGELAAKTGRGQTGSAAGTLVTRADGPWGKVGRTSGGGAQVNVSGLTFGYFPGRPVLSNVDLTISAGERVVVIGRTGAGKSSLLHLLAGLYKPWSGTIRINGLEPGSLPPNDRRRLLGVVPQTVYIFDATVRDNISLMDASITPERIERVCRSVGLHDVIAALPKGYDTLLGSGGSQLSFGQNQLLCLARAQVFDPPLLLLDEPTSGTDTETEKMIFRALKQAGQSRTMITIAHRLTGIVDAQRVIVVSGGKIVQDGTPEELAGKTGWYKVFKELEELGWSRPAI